MYHCWYILSNFHLTNKTFFSISFISLWKFQKERSTTQGVHCTQFFEYFWPGIISVLFDSFPKFKKFSVEGLQFWKQRFSNFLETFQGNFRTIMVRKFPWNHFASSLRVLVFLIEWKAAFWLINLSSVWSVSITTSACTSRAAVLKMRPVFYSSASSCAFLISISIKWWRVKLGNHFLILQAYHLITL